jgi:hypothetical protein
MERLEPLLPSVVGDTRPVASSPSGELTLTAKRLLDRQSQVHPIAVATARSG